MTQPRPSATGDGDNHPLAVPPPAPARFVAHDLDHITTAPGEIVRLFDSNGAGLAVNDLDGDGDMDMVLADLAGPVTVLWNQGDLRFRKQSIGLVRRARAVDIVDVDGDGRLDIVLTTGRSAPSGCATWPGRTACFRLRSLARRHSAGLCHELGRLERGRQARSGHRQL